MDSPTNRDHSGKIPRQLRWYFRAPGLIGIFILVGFWLPYAEGCNKKKAYPYELAFVFVAPQESILDYLRVAGMCVIMISPFLFGAVLLASWGLSSITGKRDTINRIAALHVCLIAVQFAALLCMPLDLLESLNWPRYTANLILFAMPAWTVMAFTVWFAYRRKLSCKFDRLIWLQLGQAILSGLGWYFAVLVILAQRLELGWFWVAAGLLGTVILSAWQFRWATMMENINNRPRPMIKFGIKHLLVGTTAIAVALVYPMLAQRIIKTFLG